MTTPLDALDLTDRGNGRRIAAEFGQLLCYVPGWGWTVYDGRRWKPDTIGEVMRCAKSIPDLLLEEALAEPDSSRKATIAKHAVNTARRSALESAVKLAQTEPGIVRETDAFDRQHHLLNVANGTLDTITGELHPHRREDGITKVSPVPYMPDAEAPRFLACLHEILRGDAEVIAYVQRAVGYSLTGHTNEQCFFLLHGEGSNGKGTLIRLLQAIAGDYFRAADFQTFLERHNQGVREDVADLAGARIVAAEESTAGNKLDEGLIKKLTGEDEISARRLYRDRFTFRFTGHLWLATNDRPRIHGTDHGIWRRVKLIPFTHKIVSPDRELEPHLHAHELPGILAWAIRGCLAWRRDGLNVPAAVEQATERYRQEEDVLADFLAECCERAPGLMVSSTELFATYKRWAGEQGMSERDMLSQTRFGRELTARGHEKNRDKIGHVLRFGIALRCTHPAESPNSRTVDHSVLQLPRNRPMYATYGETVRNHSDRSEDAGAYELDERAALREGA